MYGCSAVLPFGCPCGLHIYGSAHLYGCTQFWFGFVLPAVPLLPFIFVMPGSALRFLPHAAPVLHTTHVRLLRLRLQLHCSWFIFSWFPVWFAAVGCGYTHVPHTLPTFTFYCYALLPARFHYTVLVLRSFPFYIHIRLPVPFWVHPVLRTPPRFTLRGCATPAYAFFPRCPFTVRSATPPLPMLRSDLLLHVYLPTLRSLVTLCRLIALVCWLRFVWFRHYTGSRLLLFGCGCTLPRRRALQLPQFRLCRHTTRWLPFFHYAVLGLLHTRVAHAVCALTAYDRSSRLPHYVLCYLVWVTFWFWFPVTCTVHLPTPLPTYVLLCTVAVYRTIHTRTVIRGSAVLRFQFTFCTLHTCAARTPPRRTTPHATHHTVLHTARLLRTALAVAAFVTYGWFRCHAFALGYYTTAAVCARGCRTARALVCHLPVHTTLRFCRLPPRTYAHLHLHRRVRFPCRWLRTVTFGLLRIPSPPTHMYWLPFTTVYAVVVRAFCRSSRFWLRAYTAVLRFCWLHMPYPRLPHTAPHTRAHYMPYILLSTRLGCVYGAAHRSLPACTLLHTTVLHWFLPPRLPFSYRSGFLVRVTGCRSYTPPHRV